MHVPPAAKRRLLADGPRCIFRCVSPGRMIMTRFRYRFEASLEGHPMSKINWGILGLGAIARAFARAVHQSQTGALAAVASRSKDKAEQFAGEFSVPRAHGSYEELLADEKIQGIYIATPHPMHIEWAIRAAEAGKHLLVEKPIGVNHAEAMAMTEAAAANNVFLMEAFMYRCHPQTARLVELVRSGTIGQISLIQASFGFQSSFNSQSRIWSNDMAGGGLLDVGCYTVSMSRLIAGAAMGRPFADPVSISGEARLNKTTGVDEYAVGILRFPTDLIASVSTSIALRLENVVRIVGTEGSIFLPNPWVASREGTANGRIILQQKGKEQPEEIVVESPVTSFALEIDVAGRAIQAGRQQAEPPAMTWNDTLGNMRALDQWRQAIGLIYEMEKPGRLQTAHRRPLAIRPNHNMKYGQVQGVNKKLSRLVMGVDNVTFPPHTFAMWDDFFERGGNAWDTAWLYGGGKSERALGDWIKARDVREQVVILDKGAHTPFCTPLDINRQFPQSLERLQTDYVDIYMMHRDNPDIPIGEFVDVLHEHVAAGRMKAIGGSNWTIERVEAFNQYARSNGKTPFTALSNNLSLAYMNDPVWAGCLTASHPLYRKWHAATQMPLMPWSSQARGFFTSRGDPSNTDDREMVRVWHSPENFERRRRAYELAEKRGVEPINIALAWVLCQPFPTFPLIGPRQLSETRSSLKSLDIELSTEEVKWLNLEA
jgi:predicted dehydrogenase/aryl-alcohol dehydrogenase-like predicted oxidoreductase